MDVHPLIGGQMKKKKLLLILTVVSLLTLCFLIHEKDTGSTTPDLSDNSQTYDARERLYTIDVEPVLSVHKDDEIVIECMSIESEKEEKVSVKKQKVDEKELAAKEAQQKIKDLDDIEDKKEWFITYKKIIEEYEDVLDSPESIYDCFSEDELDMFFRVVQAEVGDEYEFEHKCNVASVILNRLESDEFPNDMFCILSRKQFQTVSSGIYKRVDVSKNTILACEYAFLVEDTTDGALYYLNKRWSTKKNIKWFENNLTYLFTDGSGHSFYK